MSSNKVRPVASIAYHNMAHTHSSESWNQNVVLGTRNILFPLQGVASNVNLCRSRNKPFEMGQMEWWRGEALDAPLMSELLGIHFCCHQKNVGYTSPDNGMNVTQIFRQECYMVMQVPAPKTAVRCLQGGIVNCHRKANCRTHCTVIRWKHTCVVQAVLGGTVS